MAVGGPAPPVFSNAERALSATWGYFLGALVVLPFDRVKTLVQASPGTRPLRVVRDVWSADGLRGLYRGFDAHMLIAPYNVLYYCIYDELLTLQDRHPLAPLSSAVVARTIEVTVKMPLDLLRTKLQAARDDLTLRTIVRQQLKQPISLWMRGYSATLLRDVPFSAVYWLAYEEARKRVEISQSVVPYGGLRTFLHSFACGGSAGMLAALLTTPADVVKTLRQKRQSGALAGSCAGGMPASTAYRDIIAFLARRPRRAFAGLAPRLLRVPLGLATMMSGIETSKWALLQRRL